MHTGRCRSGMFLVLQLGSTMSLPIRNDSADRAGVTKTILTGRREYCYIKMGLLSSCDELAANLLVQVGSVPHRQRTLLSIEYLHLLSFGLTHHAIGRSKVFPTVDSSSSSRLHKRIRPPSYPNTSAKVRRIRPRPESRLKRRIDEDREIPSMQHA